jgi:hypothetical protein
MCQHSSDAGGGTCVDKVIANLCVWGGGEGGTSRAGPLPFFHTCNTWAQMYQYSSNTGGETGVG